MNAAQTLEQIRLAIADGTLIGKNGSDYEDPKMTLATIEDILSDNPVEYKWRVVNPKQNYKSFWVGTEVEAVRMMDEPGDVLQRKPRNNSKWEDA